MIKPILGCEDQVVADDPAGHDRLLVELDQGVIEGLCPVQLSGLRWVDGHDSPYSLTTPGVGPEMSLRMALTNSFAMCCCPQSLGWKRALS